ncbi:MAG TPA: amidase [Pseudonocardiaceae bacterium]
MTSTRVHAFGDDALGDHDAVALADLIRRGELGVHEVTDAAIARAGQVTELNAVVADRYGDPAIGADPDAPLFGVPTFVKDNTDVTGLPTNNGTSAYRAKPAGADGPYAQQFLSTGLTMLGKSALPEYRFNASTEFADREPARNPWHTEYSVGASSGGAAALVAAGVVPIAHANDGGGSIRIPAACAGLVGLKPTRGRHIDGPGARMMPINVISEGVLTRSVRDSAAFLAAQEQFWRNPRLPAIGTVDRPIARRLRIGLLTEGLAGRTVCPETRAAVEGSAALLAAEGHFVETAVLPLREEFGQAFVQYWSMLAFLAASTGKLTDRAYDRRKLDGFTLGLRGQFMRNAWYTPKAFYDMRVGARAYVGLFGRYDLVLSPVLGHTTPRLGHLSPTVPFDELLERLLAYVCFTPVNNVAGTPAISLPLGKTADGLPIGVQLAAAPGDERTLLEMALLLEELRPWRSARSDDELPRSVSR